jgi:hypothetical protein
MFRRFATSSSGTAPMFFSADKLFMLCSYTAQQTKITQRAYQQKKKTIGAVPEDDVVKRRDMWE